MKKTVFIVLLLSAVSSIAGDAFCNWWPHQTPAAMPTGLTQFMTFTFPEDFRPAGTLKMTIAFPVGIEFLDFPTAWTNPTKPDIFAVPFPPQTAVPSAVEQRGDALVLQFPAGSFEKSPLTFLPLILKVATPPDDYTVAVTAQDANGVRHETELALKIYPPLSGERCKRPLIVWNFQGLDEKHLPVYMTALTAAGVNALYEMREETPNRKSAADFQEQYNTLHGTAFFAERIPRHFADNGLPPELAGRTDIVFDTAYMVDHPAVMEAFVKHYIDFLTDGKNFSAVVYDAERGAFKARGTRIVGDLTPYSLNRFAARFALAETPTPEIITEKYRSEWVQYNCELTRDFASGVAAVMKKYFPDRAFEIYSGYEYDNSIDKGLSKIQYAVDWNLMGGCGLDTASFGYFVQPSLLRRTADAMRGKLTVIPAEMYAETFNTVSDAERMSVGRFTIRLIECCLATYNRGIQIWMGPLMHGGALIAVDRCNRFVNLTCDFISDATGVEPQTICSISPRDAIRECYAFRKNGKTMLVFLNTRSTDRRLRVKITDTNAKILTDVITGENSPVPPLLTLRLEPYAYAVYIVE
ncbi:MAG: hypothetical protein PHI85_07845 [Victivallaceae bacterium]|nr:hypothetical protein [Victivallaceae bacterium]